MKNYQIHDLIIRLSVASGVALAMLATIHGLVNVSQHHIERDLAKYATPNCAAKQLANSVVAHKA